MVPAFFVFHVRRPRSKSCEVGLSETGFCRFPVSKNPVYEKVNGNEWRG
jgi:hypothetical protein